MKPIGIMPKARKEHTVRNSDCWEIDISENIMDMQIVVPVFIRSLQKYHIHNTLKAMGLSNLQNRTMHFTAYEPAVINDCSDCETNILEDKLSTYGLTLVLAPPDGDCFFSAVAMNLLSDLAAWKHSFNLASIEHHEDLTVEAVTRKLRQVFVREILGERWQEYEAFVSHTNLDYEKEASKFQERGYFDSELGNLMPLALSTALQLSSVIFTRDDTTPAMYITPEIVDGEATVFLVYSSEGKGHYDAAIAAHKTRKQPTSSVTRCRCGVNKKYTDHVSCQSTAFYSARCKCFKLSKPCTSECNCVGCANPLGRRSALKVGKRARRKHIMQVTLPHSKDFAEERGEKLSEGSWSTFESLVIHEVCIEHRESDIGTITKTYNDIVSYSNAVYCIAALPLNVVFRSKAETQVQSKIVHAAGRVCPI